MLLTKYHAKQNNGCGHHFKSKAGIIKKAVERPVMEFVPASYLQGHHNTTFIVDNAAAELTRLKTPWLTNEVNWSVNMIKKGVTNLAISLNKPIVKLIFK